ncbi:cytochrome P450 [Peniophora sp. CONT]|nr:cytochrome P450 [Peniophora sp. CONT]
MPFALFSLAAVIGVVALMRFIGEHGLKLIGLAPHSIHLPGPRALPFFGNLLELRVGHTRTFTRWADRYGPIIRVVIGDREAVILNTYDAVQRTLNSQGQALQGRPETREYHGFFVTAVDHAAPPTLGTSPWSARVSTYRKHLGLQSASNKRQRYNHFVARRLHHFVDLLATHASSGPRDLSSLIWTITIGLSAGMCFGTHIRDSHAREIAHAEIDVFRGPRTLGQPLHAAVPLLDVAQKALRPAHGLLSSLGLGTFLDQIVRDENTVKTLRGTEISHVSRLKAELHARVHAGDATPSQLGDILRTFGGSYTEADEYTVASSLIGSGMSTGTLLLWLTSFLAARSDIQATAYAAIEAEYGSAPPDPLDTGCVEYITALGTEAGRYFATMRLGFPRETTQDVEFLPERWCDGHYGRVGQKDARGDDNASVFHAHGNKVLYGALILLLHFFRIERAELDTQGRKDVFPAYRSSGPVASTEMDPITDQISECAAQALPRAAGVCLTPRDPAQLQHWLAEGHVAMDQFEQPDEDAGLLC